MTDLEKEVAQLQKQVAWLERALEELFNSHIRVLEILTHTKGDTNEGMSN